MQLVPTLTSTCLTALLAFPALAAGAVVQTNYGTTNGTLPGGGSIVRANNLLHTSLTSASRTGADAIDPGNLYFYREDSGYEVDLSRLHDGEFGEPGGSSVDSVLPNQASITFNLNLTTNSGGYNLSRILTYAGWDDGRDGQQYSVEYSTASAPGTWLALASASRFDNAPNDEPSATLVQLTSNSGFLAENVGALRFNFAGFGNGGNAFENGGTGYREFVVEGAGVSAVPEPAAAFGTLGLLASSLLLRRRTSRPN